MKLSMMRRAALFVADNWSSWSTTQRVVVCVVLGLMLSYGAAKIAGCNVPSLRLGGEIGIDWPTTRPSTQPASAAPL